MTNRCFVCGYDIHPFYEETKVLFPYPFLMVAHKKCMLKFKRALKKKYGITFDTGEKKE